MDAYESRQIAIQRRAGIIRMRMANEYRNVHKLITKAREDGKWDAQYRSKNLAISKYVAEALQQEGYKVRICQSLGVVYISF